MNTVRVDFEVATDEDLRQPFVFTDVNDVPLDLTWRDQRADRADRHERLGADRAHPPAGAVAGVV